MQKKKPLMRVSMFHYHMQTREEGREQSRLTVRVVHTTCGTEGDGVGKLLVRAARDIYARAKSETELHRKERDAAADARDEDVVSARDASVHDHGPVNVARGGYTWTCVSVGSAPTGAPYTRTSMR
jgi:IS5 family transposase